MRLPRWLQPPFLFVTPLGAAPAKDAPSTVSPGCLMPATKRSTLRSNDCVKATSTRYGTYSKPTLVTRKPKKAQRHRIGAHSTYCNPSTYFSPITSERMRAFHWLVATQHPSVHKPTSNCSSITTANNLSSEGSRQVHADQHRQCICTQIPRRQERANLILL